MDSDLATALSSIIKQYPSLGAHPWNVVRESGPGQLEFYHPEEGMNPTPGRPTIGVRNRNLTGDALSRAIFGDMLHYLPEVDPHFNSMREAIRGSLSPEQHQRFQQRYEWHQKNFGENRLYEDWFERSGLDAFIRGYLAPDAADEWRKGGEYSAGQALMMDSALARLRGIR